MPNRDELLWSQAADLEDSDEMARIEAERRGPTIDLRGLEVSGVQAETTVQRPARMINPLAYLGALGTSKANVPDEASAESERHRRVR